MTAIRDALFSAVAALAYLGLAATASAQSAAGVSGSQGTQMRSRLLTSLTGFEIQEYLKRNDIVFVPVGPTEINGGNPVDVEYVVPLAYSLKLAEKSDGLVLPYVSYIDPGSTNSHPSTVHSSAAEGTAYLKTLLRSLIRQGFHRIVLITSHGPAFHTVVPAQDEIFYETHISSVWLEPFLIARASQAGATPAQPGPGPRAPTRTYGAYKIVGRLNDMPVGLSQPVHEFEKNEGLAKMAKILGGIWNGKVPAFFADGTEHGGFVQPVTAAQRDAWGAEGEAMINREVAAFDIQGLLDGLREHNAYTKRQGERLGSALPGARTSVNAGQ